MATTKVGIAPMKVAQISKPGGDFEIVEREIPNPGAGEVRIKVQACGVCHSDVFVKEGLWPGIQYPRVPGHEVAGVIDEIGAGVTGWKVGQRVGVGWHGGRTTRVSNAGVDTSFTAATPKLQASATTEDISNTWSLRSKRSRRYRTYLAMLKQGPFCARGSRPLTRCDIAAHRRAVSLRCRALAASATLESNSGINLATRLPRSAVDLKILCS